MIAEAIKPGLHYREDHILHLFRAKPEGDVRAALKAERRAGLIVLEPFGPFARTFRLAGSESPPEGRAFAETLRPGYDRDWKRWFNMCDVARNACMNTSSLRYWLNARDLLVLCPLRYTDKIPHTERLIPPALEAMFLEQAGTQFVPRVEFEPPRHVRVKQAARIMNRDIAAVRLLFTQGKLRAVRYKNVILVDLDHALELVARRHSEPFPGWSSIRKVEREACASKNSARDWLRRGGFDVRTFLDPETRQNALYSRDADLERWRDEYNARTSFTRDQTYAILYRAEVLGQKPEMIARAFGCHPSAIRRVVQKSPRAIIKDRAA